MHPQQQLTLGCADSQWPKPTQPNSTASTVATTTATTTTTTTTAATTKLERAHLLFTILKGGSRAGPGKGL